MTGFLHEREFSRKTFLKGGGALIVGLSAAGAAGTASAAGVDQVRVGRARHGRAQARRGPFLRERDSAEAEADHERPAGLEEFAAGKRGQCERTHRRASAIIRAAR